MRQRLIASFVSLLVLVLAAGCGSSVSSAPDGPTSALLEITVEPADQELLLDGSEPAISKYTATGHFADGHIEDISNRVGFSLMNPELGGFIGSDFKSMLDRGGRTRVVAQY